MRTTFLTVSSEEGIWWLNISVAHMLLHLHLQNVLEWKKLKSYGIIMMVPITVLELHIPCYFSKVICKNQGHYMKLIK